MKFISLVFILLLITIPAFGETVNIFWDSVDVDIDGNPTLVVSYNVKRSDVSGGPYTEIASVSATPNPTYSDTIDLAADKFYVITAVDNIGREGGPSNEAVASREDPGSVPGSTTINLIITVNP